MNIVYESRGRAKEYSELACNIYWAVLTVANTVLLLRVCENQLKSGIQMFQFAKMQNNINEFTKLLWEKDSDVFIFMARKTACLYDCLRELGLASVNGLAVNDRVLDMDTSLLENKKVT